MASSIREYSGATGVQAITCKIPLSGVHLRSKGILFRVEVANIWLAPSS